MPVYLFTGDVPLEGLTLVKVIQGVGKKFTPLKNWASRQWWTKAGEEEWEENKKLGFLNLSSCLKESCPTLPIIWKQGTDWWGLTGKPEKVMAPHSSTLAWRIPWMEKPGRLQSMGSLRVGHDWETSLSLFTFMIGEGNGNPLQCSCLENPRDGGAWWAAVYGVAQSWTQLKRLSSSIKPVRF